MYIRSWWQNHASSACNATCEQHRSKSTELCGIISFKPQNAMTNNGSENKLKNLTTKRSSTKLLPSVYFIDIWVKENDDILSNRN